MLSPNDTQSAVANVAVSNKPVSHVVSTEKKGVIIPSHINVVIDKLAVAVNGFTAEELDGIVKTIHIYNSDTEYFKPVFGGKYKARTQIRVTPTETVLMEAGPKTVKGAQVRFDFNPSKIGADGIEQFKLLLDGMMPYGYDHLIASGKITRIDFAADIHGIHISDLEFFTQYACGGTKFSKSGKPQTVYLGAVSSNKKWAIYDKAAQLKLKNGQVITRIERRLKANIALVELENIENPFLGLSIISSKLGNKVPVGVSAETWRLFRRACKHTPCSVVLTDLEPTTRKIVREWLKGKVVKWWNPDAVWESFPSVVSELGLLTPLHHSLKLHKAA